MGELPVMDRYNLTKAENGTWSVLDAATGGPAEVEGRLLFGLELDDADDLVDVLNAQQRQKAAEADRRH